MMPEKEGVSYGAIAVASISENKRCSAAGIKEPNCMENTPTQLHLVLLSSPLTQSWTNGRLRKALKA